MIDFHTHILPGMDDGCRTPEQSIQLLREELRQGVDTVFLTPHYYPDGESPAGFLARRDRAFRELEKVLPDACPKLYPGAEVQFFEGISRVEDIRHLCVSGTDYLLLEMPFRSWTRRMVEEVFDLRDRTGCQVVLAHVERYFGCGSESVRARLRENGVLMQANVSFFCRWQTRIRGLGMLKKERIHFLGSDCHSPHRRPPNWDAVPERVLEGYQKTREYKKLTDIIG